MERVGAAVAVSREGAVGAPRWPQVTPEGRKLPAATATHRHGKPPPSLLV